MGSFSPIHWMIVALVLMGDLARGIKLFRKTMAEDSATAPRLAPGDPALADATADRVRV